MLAIHNKLPEDTIFNTLQFLTPKYRNAYLTTCKTLLKSHSILMEDTMRNSMTQKRSASIQDLALYSRPKGSVFASDQIAEFNGMGKKISTLYLLSLLHSFPSLEILNLAGSEVTDDILQCLQDAPHLESLNLSNCKNFSGEGLENLQHCPRLKTLILDHTLCTDRALEHLRHCPLLETLSLQNCPLITDGALPNIAHCPELKNLELAYNEHISDAGLQQLIHCPKLLGLNLKSCEVTHRGLRFLSHCRELRTLDLENCALVNEEGLQALVFCPKLKSLVLSLLPISDLSFLRFCPELEALHLAFTDVTDETLRFLSPLKHLKTLSLTRCSNLTDGCLGELGLCSQLRVLFFSCTKISDNVFACLEFWPHLETLNLFGCRQITGKGFKELKHCKNLSELIISYTSITDTSLLDLSSSDCPNLRRLELERTQVSDQGIEFLLANQNLRKLDFSFCQRLTDSGVRRLQFFRNLEQLILFGIHSVTDRGVKGLQFSPYLQKLCCYGCKWVSKEAIEELKIAHPDLVVEDHPDSRAELERRQTFPHNLVPLVGSVAHVALEVIEFGAGLAFVAVAGAGIQMGRFRRWLFQ